MKLKGNDCIAIQKGKTVVRNYGRHHITEITIAYTAELEVTRAGMHFAQIWGESSIWGPGEISYQVNGDRLEVRLDIE